MKQTIALLLITLCCYAQARQNENKLAPYYYLLGEYSVKVYEPDANGNWIPDGTGISSYRLLLDSTYIDEEFSLQMKNSTMNMRTTIGFDGRTNQLRLIALDKEYSTMDVYEGVAEDNKLVFSNVKSDVAFETENGQQMSFKLSICPSESSHHVMIVEYSTDQGLSWKKYSKLDYFQKQG